MDITLDMISIMNHMDFVWDSRKVYEFQIYGLLGFLPNQRFIEGRVGKTLNGPR